MLYLLLLTSVVQGCLGGGLYPTSAVSSVEAHGPLARLALQPHYGHVTAFHHLPAVAESSREASVYQLPTVAESAHVSSIYHLPTVAQVPHLQYTTQPRYVQRLVDVANSQVAIAKLQVRRPAIQKHFYDIEERTIVRPVGSAVLELEEPVSKKFVSPFSVFSSGHHTTSQLHQPLLYPVGSHPLVSYRPLPFPVQHYPAVPVQQTPQSPQYYPVISQPPQQFPPFSQPPQQYPPTSVPPQQYPSTSVPPQQYPSTPVPPQQVPTIPQLPQDPANTQPRPPQEFQFVSQPSPSPDDSSNTEFDSSDTVVVENPDFTRSSKSNGEPQEDNKNRDSFNEFEREVLQAQNKDTEQERVVQNIISDFENLQLLRMFSSRTGNEMPLQRSQQRPNFQVLLESPKIQEQPQQIQNKPSEEIESFQKSKETGLGNSHVLTQTENSIETSSVSSSQRPSSTTEKELPALYRSYFNYLQDDQTTANKHHSTGEVFSSVRHFRPEESQDNQRKLLELLTGGGVVSEVGVTRSGESVVRGRVLSVTSAPPCTDGEERVNTRRVVVSRPVHTVEEVDVHRPFTQVQRVAVHEPVHTLAPVLYH